jgi:putative nucleotidyltransferase with HDIG domain
MVQRSTSRYVLLCAIGAVVSACCVARFSPGWTWDNAEAAGFFALVGLTAQALAHRLPKGVSGSIGFIPFMTALVVAPGLPLVFAIGLAMLASEILQHHEPLKATFNVAQHVLAISLGVLVFASLNGKAMSPYGMDTPVPFVISFGTFLLVNTLMVSGVVALSQNRNVFDVWLQIVRGTVLYDLLALPVIYVFAWVYAKQGAWLASAIAVLLLGLRQLYKTNRQLETINEEMLQLMVATIEARDPYTSGHSQRVAGYSRVVAKAAGLGARAIERVYTAALLHDVGKIHEEFAPILRKPGRLTSDEFMVMHKHSERGATLVAKVEAFRDLVPVIRSHHEKWDGSGYPDKLSGEQIPMWSRVIMFADTIDAMTTDRPYRKALDPEAVMLELRTHAGRQFDPSIAEKLLSQQHWSHMIDAMFANRVAGTAPKLDPSSIPRVTALPPVGRTVFSPDVERSVRTAG